MQPPQSDIFSFRDVVEASVEQRLRREHRPRRINYRVGAVVKIDLCLIDKIAALRQADAVEKSLNP